MYDGDDELSWKARRAIRAGKLPNRPPDQTWGGPGIGAPCSICEVPVGDAELEWEIEFVEDVAATPQTHHIHMDCFVAWDRQRKQLMVVDSSAAECCLSDNSDACIMPASGSGNPWKAPA